MRQQHGGGLAEHAGLGFDAADAPADYAQAVDHGGVRVGADHGVGIRGAVHGHDDRREVFEIHLVHDAGVGRHGAEILERRLAPAQERVALLIALEFEQRVQLEGVVGAVVIDLHGVIDDQIDRDQRIGLLGIGAHFLERVAHGGEIDYAGHAGEILQDHAGRAEVDLARVGFGVPLGDVFDVGALDGGAVFEAQQVFEENLDRVGNAREIDAGFFEGGEAENLIAAAADLKLARGAKGVQTCHGINSILARYNWAVNTKNMIRRKFIQSASMAAIGAAAPGHFRQRWHRPSRFRIRLAPSCRSSRRRRRLRLPSSHL